MLVFGPFSQWSSRKTGTNVNGCEDGAKVMRNKKINKNKRHKEVKLKDHPKPRRQKWTNRRPQKQRMTFWLSVINLRQYWNDFLYIRINLLFLKSHSFLLYLCCIAQFRVPQNRLTNSVSSKDVSSANYVIVRCDSSSCITKDQDRKERMDFSKRVPKLNLSWLR